MEYYKISDIEEKLCISRSTIYRWVKSRGFPKPIKFHSYISRWKKQEVEVWESSFLESNKNIH